MASYIAKRELRVFTVPGPHPVNVPMSPVCQNRLVRDALAADAIVAVAPDQPVVPAELRDIADRLDRFRHGQSNPGYAVMTGAIPRIEQRGNLPVEVSLADSVASLERQGFDVFDGLHQFADFGGLVACVVAALPLDTVMAVVQTPLDPNLVFAEAD
jgi:hypothetical protein